MVVALMVVNVALVPTTSVVLNRVIVALVPTRLVIVALVPTASVQNNLEIVPTPVSYTHLTLPTSDLV